MRLSLILFAALLACSTVSIEPLKIDPCVVLPTDKTTCRAVPLNQPGKADYDRPVKAGDICLPAESYAALQKKIYELGRICGKACQ